MGIVVQLGHSQCLRIEGDQVKLAISTGDGEDSSDCVVRSIGFNGDLPARLEVSKDGSCSKGLLQSIERLLALVGEVPRGIFASKPNLRRPSLDTSQGNHNIEVIEYESAVEVHEAQEGLYVLHLSGFGPITNCFDFVSRHCQAIGGEEISELVLVQSPKHFPNMFFVILHIVRVDQDVVEVNYHADIKHICEYRVYKPLEYGRGSGEAERHHQPLIGAISGSEGCFPLITISNANQMVRMPKVDFSVDLCSARRVEQVRDKG
ncbi:hypothetical protein SCLCIDRAFT_113717 [Scleroderma citrinum Foug A]|uniref:Uncharacterized protein n=1 Tax=Scleroderma citrinum Foug A TaxID=1036808 RepID=A0A0C3AJT4_9AGAM|nr:hypothetical protein SCLCIDRAFT_113717 [Scleroderma citrinum Foug A]